MSIATCNAILWKWANQSASFARGRFLAGDRRKSCKHFPAGALQVAKKILRTYDTPSATCNVFQSSSLHCKLQEKLPRVTWPLGPPQTREIVIDNYLYSTTKMSRKLLVLDRALPHTRGQNYRWLIFLCQCACQCECTERNRKETLNERRSCRQLSHRLGKTTCRQQNSRVCCRQLK